MDYSLAALKVLSAQLKDAREAPSQNALTLGGILFQRAWLQGVLLSAAGGDDSRLLLDDGTGIVELGLAGEFRLRPWNSGMYVMVVGGYLVRTSDIPIIKVHKIVDLSSFPDREAMWYLEVLETYKLFYKPLIEDFI
ncbi:recQ-mediated genome instability protein 2 isoform X2 [Carica papaya]|uniref:recQ-mediated genome instability protein 2 isoform X2 n=1 Tax=Carica papaya TaxID=3649 RepID=UPI000B8C9EC6|nr:recQ-mediated genome instability protein 2 isoform X2 [Carica papaya]